MARFSWNYCIEEVDGEYVLIENPDQSAIEGWALVNDSSFEARIEKIDGLGLLAHDGVAWDIVVRKALQGSEYHLAALEHVRRYNEEDYMADIEHYIRQGGVDHEGNARPRWEDVVDAIDRYEMIRPNESDDAEVAQAFRPAA